VMQTKFQFERTIYIIP